MSREAGQGVAAIIRSLSHAVDHREFSRKRVLRNADKVESSQEFYSPQCLFKDVSATAIMGDDTQG